MKNEIVSAVKESVKESVKSNPYGFVPMLVNPALSAVIPYAIPAVLGAGAVWYYLSSKDEEPKKATPLGSLFSGPVLIGSGLGYAVGSATKADSGTRIAYGAIGLGAGWIIQHYVIAPQEYAQAYAQQQKEAADEYRWYKPWTW